MNQNQALKRGNSNVKVEETGKNIVTVSEYCYLIYFALMLFARGIGLYEGMPVYTVLLFIGLLLFGLKILLTEHSYWEYLWIGILAVLALFIYHNTGEKGLLLYFTMMLGLKNVSIKRVFQVGLYVWGGCFTFLIFLAQTGIMQDKCLMHLKHGFGYILCHGLGYVHPNVLHVSYVVFMAFILYHFEKKSDIKAVLVRAGILFLGNIYIFVYSLSFTGMLMGTALLLLYVYFQIRNEISGFEKIVIQLIFPMCVLFSVAGPVLIKGKLFDVINRALNTRYSLSNYFLTQQPITAFGTRFVIPNFRYTMDCSYVYAFMQLGIAAFVLICIAYIWLIHGYLKEKRRTEIAIILGLCIGGITEPFMFNLAYKNLIFLFLGEYLFRKSEIFEKVLPVFFSKKICVLKIGEKQIQQKNVHLGNVTDEFEKVFEEICRNAVKYILIFMMIFLVSAGTYITVSKVPSTIYVSEEINSEENHPQIYLSVNDVAEIKEAGDLIIGYSGEKNPMYAFSGNAAKWEYIEETVGKGIWCGIIACVLVALLRIKRKKV